MIIGIGTDLVQIARIRKVLDRQGTRFVRRILTGNEQRVFSEKNDGARYLAKRFAVKEAASKALGTGIGAVSWQDIEVTNNSAGAPGLLMTGAAASLLASRGGVHAHISLSDEQDYVTALVVLESGN